jgi:uncharacterized membrane protein
MDLNYKMIPINDEIKKKKKKSHHIYWIIATSIWSFGIIQLSVFINLIIFDKFNIIPIPSSNCPHPIGSIPIYQYMKSFINSTNFINLSNNSSFIDDSIANERISALAIFQPEIIGSIFLILGIILYIIAICEKRKRKNIHKKDYFLMILFHFFFSIWIFIFGSLLTNLFIAQNIYVVYILLILLPLSSIPWLIMYCFKRKKLCC